MDWVEGAVEGDREGCGRDGVVWPVSGERGALHWLGGRRREMSGEEGVVRGVGASSMLGQGFRVSGCFSSVKGVVTGRVRSVG